MSASDLMLVLVSVLATSCLALVGYIFTRQTRQTDRAQEWGMNRDDRAADKQSTQGEIMAGALARITQLESAQAKVADALDRLARLEEFRIHAMPKLDEADRTARAFVGVNEQIKTIFNRLDQLPGEVVELLKLHIRGSVRSPA